jgi:hypothetical protein
MRPFSFLPFCDVLLKGSGIGAEQNLVRPSLSELASCNTMKHTLMQGIAIADAANPFC